VYIEHKDLPTGLYEHLRRGKNSYDKGTVLYSYVRDYEETLNLIGLYPKQLVSIS